MRLKRSTWGLLLCLAACAAQKPHNAATDAQEFTAKCAGVPDGYSLIISHGDRAEIVHLFGMDSPEIGQPYGAKVTQFVSELCLGKNVTIRSRDTDDNGTILADIVLSDGRMLNSEVLRAGYAWCLPLESADHLAFNNLEAAAREGKKGLWADSSPTPPWEFRENAAKTARSRTPRVSQQQQTPPDNSSEGSMQPSTSAVGGSGRTVYITNTGKKYHSDGCRYLARSRIPISLEDAKTRGLTPCSRCGPPQ